VAPPKVETPKVEAKISAVPTPVDKAEVKDQGKVANPYKDYANAAEVSVDKWGKGKNDCLEHILKNQGFSLKDIYTKDKDGKTLVQRVAETNGLEDPNLVHAGQKLTVPTQEVKTASTNELEKGEKTEHSVGTDKAGVKVELEKKADGTSQAKAETKNEAPDAKLKHDVQAPDGGSINVRSTAAKTDEAKSTIVARTGEGKGAAETTSEITAKPNESKVVIKDTDGKVNTRVEADNHKVTTENTAADGKKITTNTDISEDTSDGRFERWGRKVSEFFTGKPEASKPGEAVTVDNAKKTTVTKNEQGVATVEVETGKGEKKVIKQTAGDTDDGLLERGGEKVDYAVDKTVEYAGKAYDKTKEVAGEAYDKGKDLANKGIEKGKQFWNWVTG
jgi:hypothetical protein